MVDRLFVYGTLAPGRPNEHVLAPLGGSWQPGSIRGRLLMEGWGAIEGYPGIVLDEQGEEVAGLVFSAEGLGAFLPTLDEFEGVGYRRVVTSVQTKDGARVEAYVYELNAA
ncbi:MAG: gamma-glutamylcyclotransferase family protein [Lautropia sp.]|nr:gamma-glutamylcyclotransferase family protein [Lautropia sp.]